MKEIWKDIPNYEDFYQVSNLGNVKNKKGLILKPHLTNSGYYQIKLFKNKKRKYYGIHRLVAQAFPEICGQMFENCEVDHIDTNRTNNNAYNLKVCDRKENHNNPLTIEHYKSGSHKGSKNNKSIKIYQFNRVGDKINTFIGIREAGKQTKIDYGSIRNCLKGRTKTAGGYIWRYAKEVC